MPWRLGFLWFLAAMGCGYRFTAGGAPLPEGIRTVAVPMFVNRTCEAHSVGELAKPCEAGLEVVFTQAMREWVTRTGLELNGNAEARIEGEVQWVWGGPTVATKAGALASYRMNGMFHVKLVKNGRVLGDATVVAAEDYLPGAEVLEGETNRGAALRRLAETLARDGYDRLATGW